MKRKPAYGYSRDSGQSYAIKVDCLDSNDFFNRPFGQKLADHRLIREWQKTAKRGYAGAKGKNTLRAVKAWVKLYQPDEFYAMWEADSEFRKNDSVEIYYKRKGV